MGIRYKYYNDIDSPERTQKHKEIISSKSFLKNIYIEWYKVFYNELHNLPQGKLIELGAGGSFMKEIIPSVIYTDIMPMPSNDMTFSALDMPFDNNSISGLFMLNVFHHLPNAKTFLSNVYRVLMQDGKLIMIEPANSALGRFIYANYHQEPFQPTWNWEFLNTGPLSGANGALPWIVLIRDQKIFKELFPSLIIEEITYHTPLSYILSGGLSFKQLVPDFTFPFFRATDKLLSKISNQLSMFMTIKIKKI